MEGKIKWFLQSFDWPYSQTKRYLEACAVNTAFLTFTLCVCWGGVVVGGWLHMCTYTGIIFFSIMWVLGVKLLGPGSKRIYPLSHLLVPTQQLGPHGAHTRPCRHAGLAV